MLRLVWPVWSSLRLLRTMVLTMAPMTVMHEDMHQRTGQQQQERQGADNMRQVLGQEEVARDRPDDDQSDRVTGAPKAGWLFLFPMHWIHGDHPLPGSLTWQTIHHHLLMLTPVWNC